VARVDRAHPDPSVVARAADLLTRSEVVAFPTDTLYGLHADPFDVGAMSRLTSLKGHTERRGYVVLCDGSPRWLDALVAEMTPAAEAAMARWPGRLTVVVHAGPGAPLAAVGEGGTIALRHADDPLVMAILARLGGPLASTSANRGGEAPLRTAAAVSAEFTEGLPLVLDGGACDSEPSTVVDATGAELRVVRPGAVRIE
jgi:tRNA threonylcarbamoyl adenosine modification protein (Sua5/YciO/YrdC/YwlC family)